MEWDKYKRPPPYVCPQEFCFHWIQAGGKVSPPGQTYASSLEMIRDSVNWPVWPEAGCGCFLGLCKRLDPIAGDADFYSSHDLNLERAGLPWFYFITLESLRPEFHEEYLRASEALWGPADDRTPPG